LFFVLKRTIKMLAKVYLTLYKKTEKKEKKEDKVASPKTNNYDY